MRSKLLPFCLLASFLLAGCAGSSGSEVHAAVVDESDFLSVSAFSDIKVISTAVKTASGSSAQSDATSAAAASSSSSSSTAETSAHSAAYYLNDDFTITNGSENFIGVSGTYSGLTQYVLINVSKKSGFVTNDTSLLDAERASTKALLAQDYSDLGAIYAGFRQYAGKTAADFANMISLSFLYSVEGTAAGYTLKTRVTNDQGYIDTHVYLTLDQVDGKWAFTNYSKRVTTARKNEKGTTEYDYAISEYSIATASAYPKLAVSLSEYSVYLKDNSIADVSLPNGIPLTTK